MKSGKGKGRGGCRGLAKRRRGNGGGCEIGLDCRQSDRERQARRSGLISLQGSTEKRVNGVAPLRRTAGTVLVVCVGVCACASLSGIASQVPGREDPDVLQGKDSKEGPSSTRFGSADYGHRPRYLLNELAELSARFHS